MNILKNIKKKKKYIKRKIFLFFFKKLKKHETEKI